MKNYPICDIIEGGIELCQKKSLLLYLDLLKDSNIELSSVLILVKILLEDLDQNKKS